MAPDPDHQTSSVLNLSGRKLPVEHPWFQDPGTQEKTLGGWVSAFAPCPRDFRSVLRRTSEPAEVFHVRPRLLKAKQGPHAWRCAREAG